VRENKTVFRSGSVLLNYEIIRPLGSGGFSVVYLGIDKQNQKYVAIKEFFPEGLATRQGSIIKPINHFIDDYNWAKNKFLEEARVLSRFDNPTIVDIIQVFEKADAAYLVMEYVQGITLKAWLKQIGGTANQSELDFIFKPIIVALSLIHRNNVLHRDISPDNIILRSDLSPVLIDFGAAREAVGRRSGKSSAVVKDGLSPPEQYSAAGLNQGPWSDIYSLSATLYYAISGVYPADATDRLIQDTLTPLSGQYFYDFRQNFLKAIDWGLKLNPTERPQNINNFENILFS